MSGRWWGAGPVGLGSPETAAGAGRGGGGASAADQVSLLRGDAYPASGVVTGQTRGRGGGRRGWAGTRRGRLGLPADRREAGQADDGAGLAALLVETGRADGGGVHRVAGRAGGRLGRGAARSGRPAARIRRASRSTGPERTACEVPVPPICPNQQIVKQGYKDQ